MNKKIALIILLLLIPVICFATGGSQALVTHQGISSGKVQGTAQVISTNPVAIYSVELVASGSNASVTLYDSESSPTTAIWQVTNPTANSSSFIDMSAAPIMTNNGLVVSVSNSDAAYVNYQF